MTTTFENAKLGDKVWDFKYGCGEVVTANFPNSSFPLLVRFITKSTRGGYLEIAYTIDGCPTKYQNRTLFWDEIKFEAPPQPVRMKMIHGVEVPDIGFEPEIGEDYCFPSISKRHLHSFRTYVEDYNEDMIYVENDLCYPYTEEGKQAAILHAKAMLGINEATGEKE